VIAYTAEPCDRRALLRGALRAAAGAALAAGLPAALTGCADLYKVPIPVPIDYLIDVAPLPPGVAGLIAARAVELGVAVPAGIQDTFPGIGEKPTVSGRYGDFVGETTPTRQAGGLSPFTDRLPRATNLAVIQADASAAAYAHSVIEQDVQVVTYLAPLRHQTAQITVDSGALGMLLATDAATWAQIRINGPATALFVAAPSSTPASGAAYGGPPPVSAAVAEQAIRAAFSKLVPNITLTSVQDLNGPVQALEADPSVRIVICADAVQAFELAQTLRRRLTPARRSRLYVGGLGNPSIYTPRVPPLTLSMMPAGPASPPPDAAQLGAASRQRARQIADEVGSVESMLDELRRDDVLRALATVPVRELAYSLVDLPVALLNGKAPYNVAIAPVLLTPRSTGLLAAYARDSRH
jgi:hypothetical protein